MNDDKFRHKYRIQSARAKWHDYNGGTYFVTICTQNREHYFGKIVYDQNNEPQMNFTKMGQYANEQIKNITNHYPYAEIPLWVVMPNHIHCLVMIHRDFVDNAIVETVCTPSPSQKTNNETVIETVCTPSLPTPKTRWKNETVNETMQNISQKRGLLSTTIGGLKRAITHFANENNIYFQWQTRFHDHIVTDLNEMNRIADYIEHNPAQWMQDKFYSE